MKEERYLTLLLFNSTENISQFSLSRWPKKKKKKKPERPNPLPLCLQHWSHFLDARLVAPCAEFPNQEEAVHYIMHQSFHPMPCRCRLCESKAAAALLFRNNRTVGGTSNNYRGCVMRLLKAWDGWVFCRVSGIYYSVCSVARFLSTINHLHSGEALI